MRRFRFARRGFRSRRKSFRNFYKPKQTVKNHYQDPTFSCAATVEYPLNVASGVDYATDRHDSITDGGVMRSVVVELQLKDLPANPANHTCLLWYRKAGETLTTPIAAYFDSTDPLTGNAQLIRRRLLSRPHTFRTVAGQAFLPKMICKWRGRLRLNDGDLIVCTVLCSENCDYQATVWLRYEK